MSDELGPKIILFSPWTFVFIILIVILTNLIIIDAALFWPQEKSQNQKATTPPTEAQISYTPNENSDSCSDDCKKEIDKAVATAIKPQQTTVNNTNKNTKEFYIPLGTGSSTSLEWVDVPGVQAYVDSSSYVDIKTVTFEVSLNTPTGNQEASARLYNITDSHPVWNSEVSISGGSPQLKISPPINLDDGSKLYQVQMKTQLGSRTNLENARIRILTY